MDLTTNTHGRAIALAVSRWLPTSAARVRARVRSCGIFGGQSSAGAGFFRVLRLPLPTSFHQLLHSHHHVIWGWYNRPTVDAIPSGLSLTLLRIILIIIKKIGPITWPMTSPHLVPLTCYCMKMSRMPYMCMLARCPT
jgi:hypothetical protein